MTEGVSFICPTGALCRVSIFRLLFVWADSILDVYAFFLAALRFPFSFFPFARSRCIFYKEEWAPPAVLCGSHATKYGANADLSVPCANRGPAAVMISRSTSASPCCRRPVWHLAWLPQPPSSRTATWCAAWCCSRCWYMSWQAQDRTDCRWRDPSRGTHQRPCGEQAGRSCIKGCFLSKCHAIIDEPCYFLYTEHSATGTIFLLCHRLAITGKG